MKKDAMKLPPDIVGKLLRFLHDDGVRFCVLDDSLAPASELFLVVEQAALAAMSGKLTSFAHREDLLLVHYGKFGAGSEGRLAWMVGNEIRALRVFVASDVCAGGVLISRAPELLSQSLSALEPSGKPKGYFVPPPAVKFLYAFLNGVGGRAFASERLEYISLRFAEDPAGAKARLKRFFDSGEVALIAGAIESSDWEALGSKLPQLRRALAVRGFARRFTLKLKRALSRPRGVLVACVGPRGSGRTAVVKRMNALLSPALPPYSPPRGSLAGRSSADSSRKTVLQFRQTSDRVRDALALAKMKFRARFLGQTMVVFRNGLSDSRLVAEPDLWIVLDAPPEQLQARESKVASAESLRERDECLAWAAGKPNAIILDAGQPLGSVAFEAAAAVLRLASLRTSLRVGFSNAAVNRFGARLLLFCCRHRIPLGSGFVRALFNTEINCPIRYPIHMPFPYGILIHRNCQIGSGVTIMQQVAIGVKTLDDSGAPVIEDDVSIGAGAKVLGAIRVGRGATIGANAIVTKNVPKLATVGGVNTLLRLAPIPPGDQTIRLIEGLKAAETIDLQRAPTERRKANYDV